MKIATYNINGIHGRLDTLLTWLAGTRPDIVCLQELKTPQSKFPEKQVGRGRLQGCLARAKPLERGGDPIARQRACAHAPRPAQGS
jgi:exodeoxyribonuclease III